MITIVLENWADVELARVSLPGNEQYLARDEDPFPLLSRLDHCSYDVFASRDMVELIRELEQVRESLDGADRTHVEEIIALAQRCRNDTTLTLTFTPFDE
ncbi:MAG: hypothetical protein KDA84_19270 [Planctomycetaceae bacterium]|nr:hypothetical protein [Planctomycetaceae bacterium]